MIQLSLAFRRCVDSYEIAKMLSLNGTGGVVGWTNRSSARLGHSLVLESSIPDHFAQSLGTSR